MIPGDVSPQYGRRNSERERSLGQLILGGSEDVNHYIELADILYLSGRWEATLAILTKAASLELQPLQRGLLLHEQAGFLLSITDRKDEALSLAGKALLILDQEPQTSESTLAQAGAEGLIAEVLWHEDRSRAAQAASHAMAIVQSAVEEHHRYDSETLAALCFKASQISALSGQVEFAIDWARRALAQPLAESERIQPLCLIGGLLRQVGQDAEAKSALEDALHYARDKPRCQPPRMYHELGLIEQSLGLLGDARAHFERALQIVDGDVELRLDRYYPKGLNLSLAKVLCELEEHRAEAHIYLRVLQALPEDDPDYFTWKLSLAMCHVELKWFDDARENFESIVKFAPSIETRQLAKAHLASLRYAIALRDYEAGDYRSSMKECESLLSEGIGNDALRADIILLLGHACVGLKQYRQAEAYYESVFHSASVPDNRRSAAKDFIAYCRQHR
ncbi:MAG TPA: hypothetical protein VFB14_22705 [Bryobacteraceae bacterium]|nr:hypothetical protein [Bryobacteraceae bacterium]